jgi:hypothetical protein
MELLEEKSYTKAARTHNQAQSHQVKQQHVKRKKEKLQGNKNNQRKANST